MAVCKAVVVLFALAYAAAFAILIIGAYGLFGQERDPLSGVFLIPLGLPWNLLTSPLSDTLRPWAAALAPGVNLAIIAAICRMRGHH